MQSFRGCGDDENFYVDLAQSRAPVWVASAISGLQDLLQPHDTVSVTESTLNRFFHPPGGRRGRLATIGGRHRPETIRRIINNLGRMMRALQNPRRFRCVSRRRCGRENADRNPDALAYAGRGTVISICPNFFNLSLTDQIGTLIHESAHHIGLMRNVISRESVMNLSLRQALTNAESYALLVIENFQGPPRSRIPPPTPLTANWSAAHMSSEVMFNEPVSGLFYEGRGRRRLLSSQQAWFEAPFLSVRPIRFRGQVRFYVDSDDMPMPAGTPIPEVRVQVLFIPSDRSQQPRGVYTHTDSRPRYMEPGLPLLISFDPDFDFTVSDNGRLRFTFWLGGADFWGVYEDTVYVRPDNDIL
jgi:hypothetical protein